MRNKKNLSSKHQKDIFLLLILIHTKCNYFEAFLLTDETLYELTLLHALYRVIFSNDTQV